MRLPSLTRHKTGQGVVRIRGKDYYCGKFGEPETRAHYEMLLAEYLANKHTFGMPKTKTSVEDLVLAYIDFAVENLDRRDICSLKLISKCLVSNYGDLPADEFGPTQYKTIREIFASEGTNRSRQYINKSMAIVLRMFRWCTGEGMVDPKVIAVLREIQCLKRGRTTAPESRPVTEVPQSVVDATLPHLPQVVADMVRLQQLLGCRPGELCSMTAGMVNRSQAIWEIDLEEHKNAHRGHSRTIFVGPRAQAILKTYLNRPLDRHCFSPREAMEQRLEAAAAARVTPVNQGNRRGYNRRTRAKQGEAGHINDFYKTSSYGHAIAYACKKAWPAPEHYDAERKKEWDRKHRWSPNQLRHAAATEIREGFSLEHCAAVLGHADVDTSKIYAKVRREKAIEAATTR